MSLWVTNPQQMANAKRRREAVTKVLVEARVLITDDMVKSAGANVDIVKIPCADAVYARLTTAGLYKIAEQLGLKVPQ